MENETLGTLILRAAVQFADAARDGDVSRKAIAWAKLKGYAHDVDMRGRIEVVGGLGEQRIVTEAAVIRSVEIDDVR